jgi:hypothetical protein
VKLSSEITALEERSRRTREELNNIQQRPAVNAEFEEMLRKMGIK